MGERMGVLAGVLSCALGGGAGVSTRFLAASVEPDALAACRFGLGFLVLLPLALRARWPRGRDWIGTALLGLMFFAGFFVVFNLALSFTTAARGALALSVLPLVTMSLAALLGVEVLSVRKTAGVLIAVGGVAVALGAGLTAAPAGAWRGDALMAGATLCMAFYSVRARPFVARSSALGFLVAGMSVGAGAITLIAAARGSLAVLGELTAPQYAALAYLGVGGGAAAFWLWIWALQHASPTRVTATMTINPVAAGLLAGVLLDEPLGLNVALGVVTVLVGLWLSARENPKAAVVDAPGPPREPELDRRR